jgi:ABC-type ATPase with predicted acetyltransferase domain
LAIRDEVVETGRGLGRTMSGVVEEAYRPRAGIVELRCERTRSAQHCATPSVSDQREDLESDLAERVGDEVDVVVRILKRTDLNAVILIPDEQGEALL